MFCQATYKIEILIFHMLFLFTFHNYYLGISRVLPGLFPGETREVLDKNPGITYVGLK